MKSRDKIGQKVHDSKVFQGALALGILGVGLGVTLSLGVPILVYKKMKSWDWKKFRFKTVRK